MRPERRIYLSPPHMSGEEWAYVRDALESNWIAPLGPHVDAFEREFADYVSAPQAAALSSGSAALHLAMRLVGLQSGEEVLCPTLSFCATANAVLYEGGRPVFIDSETGSWNIDPNLLEEELRISSDRGKLPRAVITVDLYGQCADYDRILKICAGYDLPVIEDAAEALGATYQDRKAGTLGKIGIFSFNGNKIITTSGGGMLIAQEESLVTQARYLASQAREPVSYYEHNTIGYNYRMSNLLAAVGRAQLKVLGERIEARRRNFAFYRKELGALPGVSFMPEANYGRSTRWLTVLVLDPEVSGANTEQIRLALEEENIEARPVWKPLHLQPAYTGLRVRGGGFAEHVFQRGLCLPSGSSLTEGDLRQIVDVIVRTTQGKR